LATLGDFFAIFHCTCAETAVCELPVKILTPPLNLVTPDYFCGRWSYAT